MQACQGRARAAKERAAQLEATVGGLRDGRRSTEAAHKDLKCQLQSAQRELGEARCSLQHIGRAAAAAEGDRAAAAAVAARAHRSQAALVELVRSVAGCAGSAGARLVAGAGGGAMDALAEGGVAKGQPPQQQQEQQRKQQEVEAERVQKEPVAGVAGHAHQ
jgi:hypothetical protein